MEPADSTQQSVNQIMDLLYNGALASRIAFIVLCCLGLFLFIYSLNMRIRRKWNSLYLIILCAAVLLWAVCLLLLNFSLGNAAFLSQLSVIGIVPIPALLCLHIRQQVSYKDLSPAFLVALLVVPVFLILLVFRDLFAPELLSILPGGGEVVFYRYLFYLYVVLAIVRAYLLCFDVLYQMPQRTRRSTRYLLIGISSFALLLIINILWSAQLMPQLTEQISIVQVTSESVAFLMPIITPLLLIGMLYSLHTAKKEMPASEVIVTSREFVVGSLSTAILVLSRSMKILDWNRTDWEEGYPFPKPLFKEHISAYHRRMLKNEACRVSMHDKNIIIMEEGEVEKYYYMAIHAAGNQKQTFGFILEISEVTQLYALVRRFEDIAFRDHLTNLSNRNAYLDWVDSMVKAENLPLLIFVGDVNGLKQLNDKHGHLMGDELLMSVAEIIKKAMPPGAFTARIGGDEFVMLAAHGTEEIAVDFVRKVLSLCMQVHHEVFGNPSISWGYSMMTTMNETYNEAFSRADAIMYKYKKARYEFHSSGLVPDTQLQLSYKNEEAPEASNSDDAQDDDSFVSELFERKD